MLVKCVINDLAFVKQDAVRKRLERSIHIDGPLRDLVIGHEYEAQAIEYRDGGLWLFIDSITTSDYPYPYPAEYFELLDGTVAPSWSVHFIQNEEGVVLKRLTFPEWSRDNNFYEMLVEGEANAVALYRRRSGERA